MRNLKLNHNFDFVYIIADLYGNRLNMLSMVETITIEY